MNNLLYKFRNFITTRRLRTYFEEKEIFFADEVEVMLNAAMNDRWILLSYKPPPNKTDLVLVKDSNGKIVIARMDSRGYVENEKWPDNAVSWTSLKK